MDAKEVIKQAEQEFKQEQFRKRVEEHKQKLRETKSLWDKIFPWEIRIVRKG